MGKELLKDIKFDSRGLVPVVVQQYDSKELLMMAWMSIEALSASLDTRFATYWSRSRQKLWRKGETSGNTQKVIEMYLDCDNDCILLLVDQSGPACHTNAKNCFFNKIL